MASRWRKHPFPLFLYLEWILLGIALFTVLGGLLFHPRHHSNFHPAGFNLLGILCLVLLGITGLNLPNKSRLLQILYIIVGFLFSWVSMILIARGERIFPAVLLVVVIRGCLLFSWSGRILVAGFAYISFLSVQLLSLMRVSFWGITLGRPLSRGVRHLPSEEIRRVWLGFAFNSALLYAFVLTFVLLLVGAVIAENESRRELIKANRRLRDYSLRIEDQATLQERNRIAREIHDSVGHYLTAQSIQLENTAIFLTENQTKAAAHLVKARQLGKDALANIRASVATLRTNPLNERSLKTSIEKLVTEFQSNTNTAIASEINLASILPTELSTALYRIAQEALTNIAKHSHATKVTLHLEETETKVLLSINDNGCGFEPTSNTSGFGLQGIKERTLALQGKIVVQSKPGCGCEIKLGIPLSKFNY